MNGNVLAEPRAYETHYGVHFGLCFAQTASYRYAEKRLLVVELSADHSKIFIYTALNYAVQSLATVMMLFKFVYAPIVIDLFKLLSLNVS